MIPTRLPAAMATMALLTGGCATSLSTSPDLTRPESPGVATPGIVYHLPMLQYQIDITRTLTACPAAVPTSDDGEPNDIDKVLDEAEPGVAFSTKVTAKPEYVRGESYVVDYRTLSAATKTTSFALEPYPTTGNLKAINVSVEDHSAEIIKDVAKVALVAGSFAAGGPAAGMIAPALLEAANIPKPMADNGNGNGKAFQSFSAGSMKHFETYPEDANRAVIEKLVRDHIKPVMLIGCLADARERVAKLDHTSEELEKANRALVAANLRVTDALLLTGVHGLNGARKQVYAARLDAALGAQAAATSDVEGLKAEQDKLEAALSDTRTERFPTVFSHADSALQTKLAHDKYDKLLATVVRPVVFANELATALSREWARIGPKAYARAIAHYPELKNYVDGDGKPRSFPGAVRFDTPEAEVAYKALLASGAVDHVADGCKPVRPGKGTINATQCIETKLAVHADLRSTEPEQTIPDTNFPRLGGRTVAKTVDYPARGKVTAPFDARKAGTYAGLFIRPPARGELFVCQSLDTCNDNDKRLFTPDPKDPPLYVPQFGGLRFLPFRNGQFAYNEMVVQLEPDGSLTRFEYKNKNAVAAQLAATAADVAAQVDAARTKARTDAKDARQAKLDELDYQINTIAKDKALAEAQSPTATQAIKNETADLDAQSALANAKLARLKAEAALLAYPQGGN